MCYVVNRCCCKSMPLSCYEKKLAKRCSSHCTGAVDVKTGGLHSQNVVIQTEVCRIHLLKVAHEMKLKLMELLGLIVR